MAHFVAAIVKHHVRYTEFVDQGRKEALIALIADADRYAGRLKLAAAWSISIPMMRAMGPKKRCHMATEPPRATPISRKVSDLLRYGAKWRS